MWRGANDRSCAQTDGHKFIVDEDKWLRRDAQKALMRVYVDCLVLTTEVV